MKRITVLILCLALVGPFALPATASGQSKQATDVLTFADMSDVGDARLVRTGHGVTTQVKADAPPGVYTLWWVVWNTPEGCGTPFACFEPDLFDPEDDTGLAIGYGGGAVVGAGGKLRIASHLREGQTLTGFPYPEFGALGVSLPETSLIDSDHAEIHLVLRSHQGLIPGMVHTQLKSFNGGCQYSGPLSGAPTNYGLPGPNTCTDTFFAVFPSVDS